MMTNVCSIALGAGWIGYIDCNGYAYAKAGLYDNWTYLQSNVSGLSIGERAPTGG